MFKARGRFLSSAGAKKLNISKAFSYAKAGPNMQKPGQIRKSRTKKWAEKSGKAV